MNPLLAARGSNTGFIPFLAVFVVLMLLVAGASRLARRRRIRSIADGLSALGLEVNPRPSDEDRGAAFSLISALPMLKDGPKGVRWCASGRLAGRPVVVLEHEYTRGFGRNRRTHVNTCAAMIGSSSWDLLTLTPESVFSRIGEKLGGKGDIKVEDAAFNKQWRVQCPDEGFALAVLSPPLQAMLRHTGRLWTQWWAFGGPCGLVAAGDGKALSAPKLLALVDRLNAVVAELPPEVLQGLSIDSQ